MHKQLKEKVLRLRRNGKSYKTIVAMLSCSIGTVAYHCKNAGLDTRKKRIKRKRNTYRCLQCNKILTKRTQKQFCSRTCGSRCNANKIIERTWTLIESGRYKRLSGRGNSTLKKYLVANRGHECQKCNNIGEWNGKPLLLEVDHIDGDSDNNHLDNIRLLCPNCHSQTTTYRGKNKGNGATRAKKRRNVV